MVTLYFQAVVGVYCAVISASSESVDWILVSAEQYGLTWSLLARPGGR